MAPTATKLEAADCPEDTKLLWCLILFGSQDLLSLCHTEIWTGRVLNLQLWSDPTFTVQTKAIFICMLLLLFSVLKDAQYPTLMQEGCSTVCSNYLLWNSIFGIVVINNMASTSIVTIRSLHCPKMQQPLKITECVQLSLPAGRESFYPNRLNCVWNVQK